MHLKRLNKLKFNKKLQVLPLKGGNKLMTKISHLLKRKSKERQRRKERKEEKPFSNLKF